MKNNVEKVLVTGGAGFIGSHLVDKLIHKKSNVVTIDNLITGKSSNLNRVSKNKNLKSYKKNLNEIKNYKSLLSDIQTVFHLAAHPDVRTGPKHPETVFTDNIVATFNLLEGIRKSNVNQIIFTSTSTIYGESKVFPTSEYYGPLFPISHYGSSKLSCEALISSYCHTYGIKGTIFRLANVVGSRSNHGIIYDLIQKLKINKKQLEVLGDGTQSKSYLHVSDCINGFLIGLKKQKKIVDVFNIGTSSQTNVLKIAEIVCAETGNKRTKISTSGGINGGRGWVGDVKKMKLSNKKLKKLGWNPKFTSNEAVKRATKDIVKEQV